jgi:hypothetical protein
MNIPPGTNIGMVVEGDAYFSDKFDECLKKSITELDAKIKYLEDCRRKVRSSFLRHPSVRNFVASWIPLLVLCLMPLTMAIGIAIYAWLFFVYLPLLCLMTHRRRGLVDALGFIKEEIKKVKAARAAKIAIALQT